MSRSFIKSTHWANGSIILQAGVVRSASRKSAKTEMRGGLLSPPRNPRPTCVFIPLLKKWRDFRAPSAFNIGTKQCGDGRKRIGRGTWNRKRDWDQLQTILPGEGRGMPKVYSIRSLATKRSRWKEVATYRSCARGNTDNESPRGVYLGMYQRKLLVRIPPPISDLPWSLNDLFWVPTRRR